MAEMVIPQHSCSYVVDERGVVVGIMSPDGVKSYFEKSSIKANSPVILAQSGVPTILLPAGTWNNTTGQLAVGTALPYLPSGTVWVYLFASGIASAGLYQATFTGSAASPVAQIVGNPATVAGAYTPTTGVEVTLASVTVPGGAMGPNGKLRVTRTDSVNNTAGAKTPRFSLGGSTFGGANIPLANATGSSLVREIQNRGSQQSQVAYGNSQLTTFAGGTPQYFNVDTTVDKVAALTYQIATATDFGILEGYTIEVLPG